MAKSKPYIIPINQSIDGRSAEIDIYGVIGDSFWDESLTAKQFVEDLRDIGSVDTLNVRINSPGGSVADGLAIFNALHRNPATVNVHIDGIAFSAASFIACCGETVHMASNAIFMVHNPYTIAMGDSREMRKTADVLEKYTAQIIKSYQAKVDMTAEDLQVLLDEETYMDADEAKEIGFVDDITESVKVAAFVGEIPDFLRLPTAAMDHVRAPKRRRSPAKKPTPKPKQEHNEMPDDNTQEPVAVTIAELKAKFPASTADWREEQLENNRTLDQAKDSWMAELQRQLAAKDSEIEKVSAIAIEVDAKVADLETKLAGKRSGNKIAGKVDGDGGGRDGVSALEAWNNIVDEETAKILAKYPRRNRRAAKQQAMRICSSKHKDLLDNVQLEAVAG